jgi:hypothetical protein
MGAKALMADMPLRNARPPRQLYCIDSFRN